MSRKCLIETDDGVIECKYSAAFPLNSIVRRSEEVNYELAYIGTGVIVEVGGIPYRGTTRLKFYKSVKINYNFRGSR